MARANQSRDPETFGQLLARSTRSRLILGIDLGTNCGYAYHFLKKGGEPTVLPAHMGQWDLSAGPYDSGAIRFVRLRQFLSYTKPDLVCFEDVKYTSPVKPTRVNATAIVARAASVGELFGAFKATVAAWCEENDVPCTSFGIGAIKKRATGKGNANKEALILACNEAFGSTLDTEGYENTGVDNIADAAWVCLMAQEQYGLGMTYPEEGEEGQAG